MDAEFWHTRWSDGRTAWDQSSPHRLLQEHWSALDCPVDATVFVPLCGKSVDMAWLAARGHRVIGCELSETGIGHFFEAHGQVPTRRLDPPFTVFDATGYEMWVGDIFDLPADAVATVDAIYDRAGLVALPPPTRRRYAEHLMRIVPPAAPIFLITFEYDPAEMDGPPFSVTRDEVAELFEGFHAEHVAVEDALGPNSDLGERGLTRLVEVATVLRRT